MKNCLQLTFEDAFSSVNTGRLVVAIAGSGRTADILADALHGEATDERAKNLAKSGRLQYINLIDIEADNSRHVEKLTIDLTP